MAKIQNVVETRFTTRGGAKTAKETEAIGRAQTRLGQASASSGRAFAAQASGLGGVVSAYAGAAATIFALSAAFNALNRAAENQQAIDGTRTLAATVGEQGDLVLSKIQEITKGQLSIAEAAKTTNLALSAGFNSEQIENLTKVALKASVALGRNLVDSQDRLVRGVAKIEPEILDELGIIVRLDDAVKKYADSINKAASDLTTYERSQAFANATIDQGLKKFSIIDTSVTTSAEALNKFSADLQNLADNLLGILAQVLGPFVSFLSGNFMNTLAAAGLLGGLIFSKLSEVATAGLSSATVRVQAFGDRLTETFSARAARAGGDLQKNLGKALTDFNLRLVRGDKQTQKNVRELVRLGRQGQLTATQIRDLNKALLVQQTMGVKVKTALEATSDAYRKLGIAARVAAGATAFATKMIAGATKAVNLLVGAIGKIFFVISILQLLSSTIGKVLFGVDLFSKAGEEIKSFFEDYTKKAQAAARAQAVFNKLLIETSNSASQAQRKLKEFQDTAFKRDLNWLQDFLGADEQKTGAEVTKTAEKLANRFQKRFARQFKAFGSTRATSQIVNLLTNAGVSAQGIDQNKLKEIIQLPRDALEKREKLIRELAGEQIVKQATKDLEASPAVDAFKKVLKQAVVEPVVGMQSELQKETKKLYEYLENLAPGIASRFQAVTTALTDDLGVINRFNVNQDFRAAVEAGAIAPEDVDSVGADEEFSQEILKKSKTLGIFLPMLVEYQKMLQDTAYTSEGLSKSSGALRETFKTLVEELTKMGEQDLVEQVTGMMNLTDVARQAAERIAQLGDMIKDLFGKEIKAAADLYKAIRVDADGIVRINKDAVDVERSRLNLLTAALGRTEQSEAVQQLRNRAITALKGIYVEINREIEKQNKALDKAIKKANLQLLIETNKLGKIRLQGKIDERNREIAADKDKLSQKQAEKAAEIANGLELQLKVNEEIVKLVQTASDLTVARSEETLRQNTLLREQEKISAQIAAEDARRTNQMQSTVASAFGGLFTEKDQQAIQMDALRIDASEALKLAEIQRRQTAEEIALAREKFTNTQTNIKNEEAVIAQRFELERQKLNNEKLINAERQTALEAERASIGFNATDQISQARMDRESREAQIDATLASQKIQKELTDKQLDVMLLQTDALKKHATAIGDALFQHAKKVTEAAGGKFTMSRTDFGATINLEGLTKQVKDLKDKNQELFDTQSTIADTQKTIAEEDFNNKKAAIEGARDRRVAAINSELAILKSQADAFEKRKGLLDIQEQAELKAKEAEIVAAEAARDATIDSANAALKAAEDEVSAKQKAIEAQEKLNEILNNSFLKAVNAISEKIQDRLGAAVEDFFGALREGTLTMESFKQGVKDLFIGILEDVTTSFTDEFIIAPIKDFISSQFKSMMSGAFGGLFGGGQSQVVSLLQQQLGTQQNAAQQAQTNFNILEKTFADQMSIFEGLGMEVQRVQVVGGIGGLGSPVLVTMIEGGESTAIADQLGFGKGLLDKNKKAQAQAAKAAEKSAAIDQDGADIGTTLNNAQSDLVDKSDAVGFSFENLGDLAGIAGAGLGALAGGLLGGGPVGSAVGGIVGALAGSLLKSIDFGAMFGFAAGGGVRHMAAGGALRDRVPALLEPGEFVIRKPMAKAIGGPALNAMNAHGTMPNSPNVVVNMNNQGTPQESEGKPNVQVTPEAIIVDIVTRDMQNNGPIRRSIRGNLS